MLIEKIGYPAMLEQTAEECAELCQACLKLARRMRKENPTPKTMQELHNNLCEEIADVEICLQELRPSLIREQDIEDWKHAKTLRMAKRLRMEKTLNEQA